MSHSFVRFAFLVCLGATWGCGPRVGLHRASGPASAPSAPSPEDSSADCELISEPGEPVGTVALSERVDPVNAPRASNESERLVFRQLYETLVRVDCKGRVRPGLAASWRLDASGRTWIVTMRLNSRFSDGTPVTAADVVSAWTLSGIGDELRSEIRRFIRSIHAVDDRTLEITLRSQGVDVPVALAHSDLAIAKRVSGSRWPLGTRPARVAAENPLSVATPENSFSVQFLVAPGRDLRDLLDEGVGLLLTRDPTAVEYAATLPQFVSIPLAWQQTKVLLTPGRARTSRSLSAEEREALAHDAVQGAARGALGPFWWQSLSNCEVAYSPKRDQSPATGRIVYDAADSAARDLAARLVGLRTYQSATGLTGEALASARRGGNDAGYILSLDSRPLDPCRDMQALVDDVGWIDPETIVPLADTRLQAIVRRGRSGVIVDWDGGLLFVDGRDKQ